MSRSLTARQTELADQRVLRAVPLVTLTTYSDIYAGTTDIIYRWSDRTLRYGGSEYQPFVISIDQFRETMNHLPDSSGDNSGTLRRELYMTLRNGATDAAVSMAEDLRSHNLERARVTVAQLMLYGDELDDFAAVAALAGTEHVTLFRGEVRQIYRIDQAEVEVRCGNVLPNIPWVVVDDVAGRDPKDIGKRLNLIYGRPKRVPLVNLTVGALSTTVAPVSKSETAIELTDAARFASAGTGRILFEGITWTGKSGNVLTGVTRGASGTTATTHIGGSTIVELPTALTLGIGIGVSRLDALYVRNLLNDQLIRVRQQYTVDTADATTISGATISSLSMSQSAAGGILSDAISQARMLTQPNFSTTAPSVTTATTIPVGATTLPTGGVAEGDWPIYAGTTPQWTYINNDPRKMLKRVWDSTGLSGSDEVLRWRLRIKATFTGSGITHAASLEMRAFGIPGIGDGTVVGVGTSTIGATLESIGAWISPPAGTVMLDLVGAYLQFEPQANEPSGSHGQPRQIDLVSGAWGLEAEYTTTSLLYRVSDAEITAAAGGVGLEFFCDATGQETPAYTPGSLTQLSSCDGTTGWTAIQSTLSTTTTSPQEGTGALRIIPDAAVTYSGALFTLAGPTDLTRRAFTVAHRLSQAMIDVLDPLIGLQISVEDASANVTVIAIPYNPTADVWDVRAWWLNEYDYRTQDDADLTDIVNVRFTCNHTAIGTVTTEHMDLDDLNLSDDATPWDRNPQRVIVTPTDIARDLHVTICGESAATFDDDAKATATDNLRQTTELHVPLNAWGITYEQVVGRLAYESRTQFVLREGTSAAQISAQNAEMNATSYDWPAASRTLTQWQRIRERGRDTEDLATGFRLLYDRDWTETGIEAYRAAAAVDKTASDLTHAPTAVIDRARLNQVDHPGMLFDAVRDVDALDVIGAYYVRAATTVPRLFELDGVPWVEAYVLERGDIVQFTPPWRVAAVKTRIIEVSKSWRTQLIDLVVVEVE